jgi:hypothetical protein
MTLPTDSELVSAKLKYGQVSTWKLIEVVDPTGDSGSYVKF